MGNDLSSISESPDASIVIVGAGFGGAGVALQLKSTGKIKIINPYDFRFHNIAALRATVEPGFTKKLMIPLKPTFGDAFVKGTVTQINKERNSVTLEDGQEITYSHLVLATGASSPFPAKLSNDYPQACEEETLKLYSDINEQVKQADTIVCVGGGAVGVELSGELKTDFPSKKIILIHSNDTLVSPKLKHGAQKSLKKVLADKNIEVMLNERVSNFSEIEWNKCSKGQIIQTESGQEIPCDLVLRCTGTKPNTDKFKDALGSSMTENGLIKVNEFLQVEGTSNIFALGDITDVDEEKMAVTAGAHASIVAKNIAASIKGTKMQAYKPGAFLMLIPVGRDGGVSQLPFMVLGDTFTKNVKSIDLFTKRYWGEMGQKCPK